MSPNELNQPLFKPRKISRRRFIAQGSRAAATCVAAGINLCKLPWALGSSSQVIISRDDELQKNDTQDHTLILNDELYGHIYDKLYEWDAQGKIIPSLAESYEVSKDGLAWTFHLKKGIKFQNGEPFNSQSVKVTIERLKDRKLMMANTWLSLDRVDTPDEYTATIRTQEPMGIMLVNLASMGAEMLPPKALTEKGVAFFDKHVGTGPYKFIEWVKNERFVMERWPDSWDKRGKIDRIIHRPILEESTRIAALRRGEIDIAENVPPEQLRLLEAEGKFSFLRVTTWDQLHLGLKCDQPPFNKKPARQAMNYAVDRDSLVNKILLGGRPSVAAASQGLIGYHPGLKPFPYDPERAKMMLREAGYKGEKLRFIGPQAWYPKMPEVEQALAAQFGAAGLNVELSPMEGAAFTAARRAGTYNIYVTGAALADLDVLLVPRVVQDIFKSGYKNDELFKLILAGQREVDQAKRQKIYEQAQEIMYEEAAPFIWLYQMEQINALKKSIKGYFLRPTKRWSLREAEIVGS
jgi:ABC-type transport system substrate-binding protein